MNASDWKQETESFGLMLFVGRSGCGKSAAAASHPGERELFDMDYRFAGVGSALGRLAKAEGLSYDTYPGDSSGYAKLAQKTKIIAQNYRNSGSLPNCLQFDSLSSFNEMLLAYVADARKDGKGQFVQVGTGPKVRLTDPGDYRFELQASRAFLSELKMLPTTVIWTSHINNRYGKPAGMGGEYKENIVIGETLNVRDKFAEDFAGRFDNVFRFDRELVNSEMRFTVQFFTDLAKNTHKIPPGEHNWTNVPFFTYFKELIKDPTAGTLEIRKRLGV